MKKINKNILKKSLIAIILVVSGVLAFNYFTGIDYSGDFEASVNQATPQESVDYQIKLINQYYADLQNPAKSTRSKQAAKSKIELTTANIDQIIKNNPDVKISNETKSVLDKYNTRYDNQDWRNYISGKADNTTTTQTTNKNPTNTGQSSEGDMAALGLTSGEKPTTNNPKDPSSILNKDESNAEIQANEDLEGLSEAEYNAQIDQASADNENLKPAATEEEMNYETFAAMDEENDRAIEESMHESNTDTMGINTNTIAAAEEDEESADSYTKNKTNNLGIDTKAIAAADEDETPEVEMADKNEGLNDFEMAQAEAEQAEIANAEEVARNEQAMLDSMNPDDDTNEYYADENAAVLAKNETNNFGIDTDAVASAEEDEDPADEDFAEMKALEGSTTTEYFQDPAEFDEATIDYTESEDGYGAGYNDGYYDGKSGENSRTNYYIPDYAYGYEGYAANYDAGYGEGYTQGYAEYEAQNQDPTSSPILSGTSGKNLAIGAGATLATLGINELLATAGGNDRTARQVLNRIGGTVAESTICGANFNFGPVSISGSEFCDIAGLFNRVPTGSLDEGLAVLDDHLSGEITENTDIRTYILQVTNFFLGFLGLIAVLFVIYGGFLYVTSGGNNDKVDQGKKIITYAVIGIFIILASFALVNTVINFKDEGSGRTGTSSSSGTSGGGSTSSTSGSGTSTAKNILSRTNGATQNGLQELSGIMDQLAPKYRDAFENHVQAQEELLPALQAREELLDQILRGETDIEVNDEVVGIINEIKEIQSDLGDMQLEDFTDNESMQDALEKAKRLKYLYSLLGHNVPELDDFIENLENSLYGEEGIALSTGHYGSPIARLSFSQGNFTTDTNGLDAWEVNLSGANSEVPEDLSVREIMIDYDTEVDGDEEIVTNLNSASFDRLYPVREKNYSVSLKITDNMGESDTVIREFKVSENGVTAVDNNDTEGEQAIARLRITKNTNSSSDLALVFDPTYSTSAENAEITSYYIDVDLENDSDGDDNEDHDHNLYGTDLTQEEYTYDAYGTYQVKLVVTDSLGNQDSVVQEIKISETGLDITETEVAATDTKMNYINGIELLDYIRYGYNLNNYSLDIQSIRQALEKWYQESVPHTPSINSTYTEMMFALDDMIATDNYDTAPVRHFSEMVVEMLDQVSAIPSIVTKITAKPDIRGKAPFTVELNGVESYAPADSNISLGNEGYCWYGISTNATKGIERSIENSFYGPIQSVTFNEPGSYLVRLVIPASGSCEAVSIQQDTAILSGSDTVLITVLPPSTDIKVSMTPPCLSNYADDKNWGEGYDPTATSTLTNDQACYISLAEARGGVSFDPSQTTAATGRTIESLEWKIGNKRYGPYTTPQSARITHTGFGNPGTYYVDLTTIDSAGEKDTFSIDLNIMEVVANISNSPSKGNVETEFNFSAAGSESDNSTITQYDWAINYLNSTGKPIYTSNESNFKYQFEQPGKYNVSLVIGDSQGRTASTNKIIEVISEPPVATFSYRQKSKSQPSTYTLDARKSYDTDSQEVVYCEWIIDGREIEILGGEGECYNVENSYAEYEDLSDVETNKNEIKQLGTGIFEYTFDTTGPHEVILVVRGDNDQSAESSRVINISSALSVDFDAYVNNDIAYAAQIGDEIRFTAKTRNATSFDWSFGDSSKKSTTQKDIKHTYTKSGEYIVTLRAFDNSGDSNTITKRIVIGKQDKVVAMYKTYLNNQTIDSQVSACDENTLEINRNALITFDASDSINVQGGQGNLEYSWDFGDGIYFEGMRVNHSFSETSGKECFPVTLVVRDKTDPTLQDTATLAHIRVVNAGPTLSGIRITTPNDTDVTPFNVSLSAVNSKDADGRIIKYTWWYYVEGDNTKRGLHETITSYTNMTLNPIGAEGQNLKYYFVVQMEDNEGKTTISTDEIGSDPFINTITGHNNPPVAFFSVDKVAAKAGEEIHFSASIKDDLGELMPQDGYHWDFDGDGKYDDSISGSFVAHRYNTGGTFNARLKVIKNGLSATYEMPITIEADTLPPRTAFTYRLTENNEVIFVNASQADASLGDNTLTYAWDFDTNTDSNNDGDPANDIDSTEANPTHVYNDSEKTTYNVLLKATDISDISNEIIRPVNIDQEILPANISENNIDAEVLAILNSEPTPNKYNGQLYLENSQEITLDLTKSRGNIAEYRIDKNIYFDSDGDGNPENDVDNRDDASFIQGGKWTTYYDSTWAPVTTKLEIITIHGETSTSKLKVNFGEKNPTYADISFNTDNGLAYFYAEPKIKTVNTEIKFDASQSAAEEIESYVWDFNGDDTIDLETTDPIATYKYATVGEKTVKLITKSKGNITSGYTAIIIISSDAVEPSANFEYIAEGTIVNFYNQSTVDENLKFYQPIYEWKFYENPIGSENTEEEISLDGNINPSHQFGGVGEYRVVLTVTDYYGQSNSIEKTVEITTTEAVATEIPEETTAEPVQEEGGSIWSTIFNIVFWGGVIIIIIAGGVAVVSFVVFRKNYPGHSVSDFVEYIQMTLAGEEYRPAPMPSLAKDTELPETPNSTPAPQPEKKPESAPTPNAESEKKPDEKPAENEPKEQPKPASEEPKQAKIEPKQNTDNEKMPDWLKPKN